jgi:hypothetical protein
METTEQETEHSESNKLLVSFLRELADSIEKKQLLLPQLKSVGEFFMAYQFQEESLKDEEKTDIPATDFDLNENDFFKFIVLGWYVYCVLLKDEQEYDVTDID